MLFLIQSAQAEEILEIDNLPIHIWWLPYLFLAVKYFLMFLSVLLAVATVLVLVRIQGSFKVKIKEAVEEALEAGRLPKTRFQKEWDTVISKVESNNPEDYKEAVVLAERLFERVLKLAEFSGENLEKRLEKVPENQLEFKEEIIWAHNLRNKILSNANLEVAHEEAKRAVDIFQRGLRELNVL